jgi:maleylacetate reductase
MLSAVMEWNVSINTDRQDRIVEVVKDTGIYKNLGTEGLIGKGSAGDLLKSYIRSLGMPGSMSEVGAGREKWDRLAKASMTDPWWLRTNSRKVTGLEDLLQIFELAK